MYASPMSTPCFFSIAAYNGKDVKESSFFAIKYAQSNSQHIPANVASSIFVTSFRISWLSGGTGVAFRMEDL